MEPTELLSPDLSAVERQLLLFGLNEWRGPARCTIELAVAMGFDGLDDFFETTLGLAEAIESSSALSALDWARVLLATEIVFVSNVVGAGHDWMFTTGMSDSESIEILRRVQTKLPVKPLVGRGLGTR